MGLKINNKLTAKQKAILIKLGYIGTGEYVIDNLTVEAAGKIIDELFIEQKHTYGEIMGIGGDYYDYPEQH
jgi:hypothetical protein